MHQLYKCQVMVLFVHMQITLKKSSYWELDSQLFKISGKAEVHTSQSMYNTIERQHTSIFFVNL